MRSIASKTISVIVVLVLLLCTNGNPVVRNVACAGENCNLPKTIEGVFVKDIHTPKPPILPRAGAGGRPSKPNDRVPEVVPTRPNDPNNPNSPGSQTGERGGFDSPDTVGGFSGLCQRKTIWSVFWPRAGCESGRNRPSPAAIRTNDNSPATGSQKATPLRDINIQTRADEFRHEIQQHWQNRPWFFFSGIDADSAPHWQQALNNRMNLPEKEGTGSIQDFVNVRNPEIARYVPEYQAYKAEGFDDYFWAANSKAFAQAVQGRIYVVIPGERAINQPYDAKGSNWWSFEVPELTRNPNVQDIVLLRTDDRVNMNEIPDDDFTFNGPNQIIWQRGDNPLGFPADEHFGYSRPQWPFEV
ncbi:hypothetical protein DE146DRAFT_638192 [Phaeosphaeria sp. MPI-PUGE-AT-0046c]|nr:hypothetical protein DE146DRAFT_638192 [Phaeosphaeria sp. MPI-PUGE-AT-0046c]